MILVTGATGDVGGEVVRQLVAAGETVRVLARDPVKAAKLGPAVEVVRGDLLQPETLTAALVGAEKLFLMAGAEDLPAVAQHAIPAAKHAGVRHVVLLSSSTILTEPMVTIGKWHLAAEQHLEASGLAWTMLRPGNFASNALRWAPTIKAQGAVYGTAGDGKSAPIDPYDIASVAAKALTTPGHEGKRYVLTSEELLTMAEQVDAIGAAIGKPVRLIDVPEAGARAGMLKSGMNEVLVDALLELMTSVRTGGGARQTTTVREVTGVAPRTFATWVRAHLSAFA
jgi:uncharacterized protein YbjT (DUF2867 family)